MKQENGVTSAASLKTKIVNKLMEIGDNEPPSLPNDPTLRKIFQEKRDEMFGIEPGKTIRENFTAFKNHPIKKKYFMPDNLGYEKSYLMYWSREQIEI